ncbi:MAG: hypothetical protein HQK53_05070, partial [Oligoflexia bacterium]|nr:hypothetical protein [Oligoflexia bacterium]
MKKMSFSMILMLLAMFTVGSVNTANSSGPCELSGTWHLMVTSVRQPYIPPDVNIPIITKSVQITLKNDSQG